MRRNRRVFIIAEAGVNHNGDPKIARRLVEVAKKSGADAIKFQTFKTEDLVTLRAPKAKYQIGGTAEPSESQFEMLKRLELSRSDFEKIANYCRSKEIIFMSTPFDIGSIDFLNGLGMSIFKIPSGEITNLPYLRKIGSLRKKVILSTGMSNLNEISRAIDILIRSGTKKSDITVLHCTTEYPAPFHDVNLQAMLTIRDKLKVDVGYSDHTAGIEVSVAAVALGAKVIEKHFTLSRTMKGPDHKASLESDELKTMVKSIRNVEMAMGDGIKKPAKNESEMRKIARRSLVAARDIKAGEVITRSDIAVKRPGTGIPPDEIDQIVNKKAAIDISKDSMFEKAHFCQ